MALAGIADSMDSIRLGSVFSSSKVDLKEVADAAIWAETTSPSVPWPISGASATCSSSSTRSGAVSTAAWDSPVRQPSPHETLTESDAAPPRSGWAASFNSAPVATSNCCIWASAYRLVSAFSASTARRDSSARRGLSADNSTRGSSCSSLKSGASGSRRAPCAAPLAGLSGGCVRTCLSSQRSTIVCLLDPRGLPARHAAPAVTHPIGTRPVSRLSEC